MVFSISKNFNEEKENWDAELKDVIKRFAFVKFNNWIEKKVSYLKKEFS